MPTIEGSKKDLEKLVGKKFSKKELEEALLYVKGELDELKEDSMKIDIKETNRPDLWSLEGIARELRARLGIKKGLPKIETKKGNVKVIIEKSVKESRPLMVAAIVKNIKVTEDFLIQMIQLQEKVGLTFGRRRKETGIGLYDFDKLKPPVYYRGYRAREIKFAPLEFESDMHLDEILEHHPKGKEYGHLIKSFEFYPIVIDSKGTVCSMPPIINSNYTGKVTEKTKNLFVEVTGYKEKYVNTALQVIVAALAERGGKVEQVKIIDGKKSYYTPDFTPKKHKVPAAYFNEISGMQWNNSQIIELLKKAGYNAKAAGENIECEYPTYRQDIIHAVDIVEDAIISYGYNNIVPEPIKTGAKGEERKETRLVDKVRDCCVGLGFQEILTFVLTSKENQQGKMLLQKQDFVEIANPMSAKWEIFRQSLLPSALEFLSKNLHVSCPQKVFETGKVVVPWQESETGVFEPNRVCILICHDKTNFTEIKSHFDALAKNMGWETSAKAFSHPSFIEGRTAIIQGKNVSGIVGEINKKVLQNFGIENTVTAAEIEY